MEFPHRKDRPGKVLEVGAGSGVYRLAATPAFSSYVELDLREWPNPSPHEENVSRVVGDAQNLDSIADNSFDRLVATCLLVHLNDPMRALEEWKRVVRPGGHLTIYVPPEAGWLVRVARNLGPWRMARRRGFDPKRLAYLEHKYSYFHLDTLIREVFFGDRVRRRTFPLSWFVFDLALFHSYEIQLQPSAAEPASLSD